MARPKIYENFPPKHSTIVKLNFTERKIQQCRYAPFTRGEIMKEPIMNHFLSSPGDEGGDNAWFKTSTCSFMQLNKAKVNPEQSKAQQPRRTPTLRFHKLVQLEPAPYPGFVRVLFVIFRAMLVFLTEFNNVQAEQSFTCGETMKEASVWGSLFNLSLDHAAVNRQFNFHLCWHAASSPSPGGIQSKARSSSRRHLAYPWSTPVDRGTETSV
ncbi:hypothetical protein C8R45DRAFT_946447 [Mycena sanguinolenta]|nr:hypothetical protein C8R45DRAFT_946447 [Mycena sanguinolenta]